VEWCPSFPILAIGGEIWMPFIRSLLCHACLPASDGPPVLRETGESCTLTTSALALVGVAGEAGGAVMLGSVPGGRKRP
jgi:hypothetical protein